MQLPLVHQIYAMTTNHTVGELNFQPLNGACWPPRYDRPLVRQI
jgi:hypothetical protein